MSFGNESKKGSDLRIDAIIKAVEGIGGKYRLGISTLHEALSEINMCIKEALLACDAARAMQDKNIVFYRDLGIYRLLMLLKNEPELKNYMSEIINPVKEYDRKYRTRLLETMISYVENDGDIARTAKALFLHVNTIRYRIEKIKEILHMEHMVGGFYEQISIAVKIHKLCR
jgi:DNA-binding PucR family transcriptional regulator